jgi:anhydro-N-acetylmuramic acid kinase
MSLLARLLSKRNLNVIGIMSGTSLDGLDIAMCRISPLKQSYRIRMLHSGYAAYPKNLRRKLMDIVTSDSVSKKGLTSLEAELGDFCAGKITSFISANKTGKVDLIGSHGQTIYHFDQRTAKAGNKYSLTWQIVDGDQLAVATGIPVISDFRRKDTALGGSGAPLAPICHYHLFGERRENRAVLNIGGIANLTYLPGQDGIGGIQASDCGPGNMLVDQLMGQLCGKKYDTSGGKALSGDVSNLLLRKLTSQSWFKRAYPKSLGREQFGPAMVQQIVQTGKKLKLSKADIIATVSELTIKAVIKYISNLPHPSKLIVAGGGVHNKYFMKRLSDLLPECDVTGSGKLGIGPDYLEAVSFALLAAMYIKNDAGNLPRVTGAARPAILGKLSLP